MTEINESAVLTIVLRGGLQRVQRDVVARHGRLRRGHSPLPITVFGWSEKKPRCSSVVTYKDLGKDTYKDLGKDTYKDLGKDTYKHTGGALELCYMCHVSHIRTHTSTQEAQWSCAICVTHKDR